MKKFFFPDREDYLIFALAKGYSTFNSNHRNKTIRNLISRSLKNYPNTINKFEVFKVFILSFPFLLLDFTMN